jgi:phosphomannomutase
VRSADGWWLIRASNTEAALVARAEAGSAAGLDQLIDEIQTTLKAAGLDWHYP